MGDIQQLGDKADKSKENMKYKEKVIEKPINYIPPKEMECPDCKSVLKCPDYRCEICKHEIVIYLV